MIPAEYQENLEAVQRRLLDWLRAFERENEDIGFDAVAASQARLQTAAGDLCGNNGSIFALSASASGIYQKVSSNGSSIRTAYRRASALPKNSLLARKALLNVAPAPF